jgi:hypothetical protein
VLIVVGLLSRRLGAQTHIKPYYLGFFAAAMLMVISVAARLFEIGFHLESSANSLPWVLLEDGLPALAVTMGVIFAWRYWSWLLAERD